MSGNTWEWTESERSNEGRTRFCYIRGALGDRADPTDSQDLKQISELICRDGSMGRLIVHLFFLIGVYNNV